MIDPHVHLRDWNQSNKETLEHGLKVAYLAGLDAVFEMPNTDPPMTSRDSILKRIELADKILGDSGVRIFHGIYAGITANQKQIGEVVNVYRELFPRVVGLKMFAGHSTGNMGIIKEEDQRLVYHTLARRGYRGVLAVHCEKESELKPNLWNPSDPYTHSLARPPESEVESVKDQLKFAQEEGYRGILHICHISVPEALEKIESERENVDFRITCGATPHHCMLYNELMKNNNGLLLKMNPPLRPRQMQEYMLQALIDRRIEWIETDHAPHTLDDKLKPPHASGIPGLYFYPHFVQYLRERGVPRNRINALTHDNITRTFGVDILDLCRTPDYSLAKEYDFDPFGILSISSPQS